MIDVELSNIWGSVSLPDLLSGEKDLFDAHMQLRTNQPDGPDFLGWLNAPEGVMAVSYTHLVTNRAPFFPSCPASIASPKSASTL